MIKKLRQRLHHRLLDRMVLRPSRESLAAEGQTRFELSTPRGPLEYFVRDLTGGEDRRRCIVLKFPGTAGRAERSSDFPLALMPGVAGEIWTLNPPGYGRSRGRASLASMVRAATALADHATADSRREMPLILCGNSLGSVVALGVADALCQRSSGAAPANLGLVLRNPPPLADVVRHVAARYPFGKLVEPIVAALPAEMDALHTAPRVPLPAVFLQSESDTLVLPEFQRRVHAAYAGPQRVVLLEELDHDGLLTDEHLPPIVDALGWLMQRMSNKRGTSDGSDDRGPCDSRRAGGRCGGDC